jgi:hypothetical protein
MRQTFLVALAVFAASALPLRAADVPALSGTDYAEINSLYARYVWAIDSSDGDMFASVFTADGEFVIGDRTTKGRKDIAAIAARGPRKERPKIFHITTNVLITPSLEGATGHAYVMLVDLARTRPFPAAGPTTM